MEKINISNTTKLKSEKNIMIKKLITISLSSCSIISFTQAATPYIGTGFSWDHLSGKRSESLKNEAGHTVTFSERKSLSSNKMNGYLFAGIVYNSKNTRLFIAPELQIGQGAISSNLDKNVPDQDYQVGGNPLLRNPNPKLSRNMNISLVTKIGANIQENYSIYGIVGIDASHFRYTYTYQDIDYNNNVISGTQKFKKEKWMLAPVFGAGIGKKFDKVGVNLEYRIAPYNAIKISKTITTNISEESVLTKVKPITSTVMIRFSYFF